MDWRDFVRGFFGGQRRSEPDVWPPAPPIKDFENRRDESKESTSEPNSHGNDYRNSQWERGEEPESLGGDVYDFPGDEFGGNRFVFGNMFSMMGEVLREMDRAVREMDGMFENFRIRDHSRMLPPNVLPDAPPNDRKMLHPPQDSSSDSDNLRDLVLKEPGTSSRRTTHYLDKPNNAEDKVDRDLDDLYNKSMLDLSEIPVPTEIDKNKGDDSTCFNESRILPFGFGFHGGHNNEGGRGGGDGNFFRSSYQKTYQTYTFKNGKWEGELVKEDANGKSVTRYFHDENGQKQEMTEYYPKESNATESIAPSGQILDEFQNRDTMEWFQGSHDFQGPSLFNIIERFFRPRM